MCHALVERIARKNFERAGEKDFDALRNGCTPDVHRFGGSHALGGKRHDRESLRQWFGRLGRVGKHLKHTVEDVWVKGLPHDTTVIVRWSATDLLPDGAPYRNRGVHIVKMGWGKVVDIDAEEDTQAVAENLPRQAALDVAEAAIPQIVS